MAGRRKSRYALGRRHRAALISIALVVAALLVWLDRDVLGPRWSKSFASRTLGVAKDIARYDGAAFVVVRVVDGDTLHLDAPDGSDPTTTVRLLGIDTPEMGFGGKKPMYYAHEATKYARSAALGKTVTVYLDEQAKSRDSYDRLLAYIELPDGTFLNEQLLLEGFAYADLRFQHGYFQKYRQLEASARALDKGLWAEVTPDRMPEWRQGMQPDSPSEDRD